MLFSETDIEQLSGELAKLSPQEILVWAAKNFVQESTEIRHGVRFGTGFGVEGCVLIDMIARAGLPISVFTLDTGLFFEETYALWKQLESVYSITIEPIRPQLSVADQAIRYGESLWQRDPDRCCNMRKVLPLAEAMKDTDAWISAIRSDQSRVRRSTKIIERDTKFGLIKISPLLQWQLNDVWLYVKKHKVPYNPLHDQSYPSIGCRPCTSPVAPGEDPRAGRWRGQEKTECGLHGRFSG